MWGEKVPLFQTLSSPGFLGQLHRRQNCEEETVQARRSHLHPSCQHCVATGIAGANTMQHGCTQLRDTLLTGCLLVPEPTCPPTARSMPLRTARHDETLHRLPFTRWLKKNSWRLKRSQPILPTKPNGFLSHGESGPGYTFRPLGTSPWCASAATLLNTEPP